MKTRFSIEIYKGGTMNDHIVRMITNHNEGRAEINLELIWAYCKAYYAEWPTVTPEIGMNHNIGNRILEITENGKPTITIIQKEIYELIDSPQN